MTDFNPGPGWREVQYGADAEGRESLHWKSTGLVGAKDKLWVREEPVPAFPTAPYTVIRVTWFEPGEERRSVLTRSGMVWFGLDGSYFGDELSKLITEFVVLSEPRAVTAKAVLDQIALMPLGYRPQDVAADITAEFGVAL